MSSGAQTLAFVAIASKRQLELTACQHAADGCSFVDRRFPPAAAKPSAPYQAE